MEDTRRQTGQNKGHSQNGESRRTSAGSLPGFEGMNFEEQRREYEKGENAQNRNEQSGQNAPAMNE
jgi:hypothetical protein